MPYKNNTNQRNKTIQGLRSFKDTLPTKVKKIIKKKGHIFSEILNNWNYIVGDKLFKNCFPKSFKNSNKFSVSTLVVMVKRGHEIELEYSKKEMMNRMNTFFGNLVVERIKFVSFNEKKKVFSKDHNREKKFVSNETNNKYQKKIEDVKNNKIKKSLLELVELFKKK